MPNAASSPWLTMPARPKSRIRPRPTTNGGVMIGKSARALSGRFRRVAPRSATSAIMVPRSVVPVAVNRARKSVFQATPQRSPPARQPRPQTGSVAIRPASATSENRPVSSTNAPARARATGKATKSSSSATQQTIALAVKASPRTQPSLAVPAPRRSSDASSVSAPPRPMPGWPAIAKPPPRTPPRTTSAPALSSAPCRRRVVARQPRNAIARPSGAAQSHARP